VVICLRPTLESPDLSDVPAVQWNERLRLFRDSFWNIVSLAVSGIVGLLLVPIMLSGLGMERYGLWLAVSSIVGIASGLGFGLGLSVVREVAASSGNSDTNESERLVSSARILYLLLGAAVMVGLTLLAGVISLGLHLSSSTRVLVFPVCVIVGLAFVGEQLSAFALAVLAGLRRFDLIGMVAIIGTISNAVLLWVALRTGHSLIALAVLRAVVAFASALTTSIMVLIVCPVFGHWKAIIDLQCLRSKTRFVLASQANTVIGNAVFDGVAPLIGFLSGAAAIVPYRIGLKFPQFLGVVSGRVAEVLYPASSEYEGVGDTHKMKDALRWGTRILVLLNIPALTALFVLAPTLLHFWVPATPPEAIPIMRVYILAILFDVAGYTADNLLWGVGMAEALLKMMLTAGVVTLGLGTFLVFHIGVVGMAIGTASGFGVKSFLLIRLSSRRFGVSMGDIIGSTTCGLIIPTILCAATIWTSARLFPPNGLSSVALLGTLGMAVYGLLYFRLAASVREREMILAFIRSRWRVF